MRFAISRTENDNVTSETRPADDAHERLVCGRHQAFEHFAVHGRITSRDCVHYFGDTTLDIPGCFEVFSDRARGTRGLETHVRLVFAVCDDVVGQHCSQKSECSARGDQSRDPIWDLAVTSLACHEIPIGISDETDVHVCALTDMGIDRDGPPRGTFVGTSGNGETPARMCGCQAAQITTGKGGGNDFRSMLTGP
ncbi:Hypothetical protein CINCED_3A024394 [Cinara cedri]|uniref:Uncharacterized protein n=1 Tax=Cinara cedri TaxID=506608 RepID=A0A5E4MNF0_9HEMI|nr:Hypothetical protein CINCED_3A024394 [Cinara cedri]